ncbi:MAG: indolepyruvate oxidoreductase subunit B, partial [Burkholderiales bacterium PBB5]
YDDVIRVAELTTRTARSQRVRAEVGAGAGEVVGTVEFFHPRLEEIYGLMPPGLVRWVDGSPTLRGLLQARLGQGQRLRPHTVRGQLMLQGLAALRRWRRRSSRHATEQAHTAAWLDQVRSLLPEQPALALELLRCRRLVKGYSDTHARGGSKFDQLQRAAGLLRQRADGAAALASLREAALADVA